MQPVERRILIKAANMYYVENLKQSEIAQRMGIDRTTVSKYLKKALRDKIVKITVESDSFDELEADLERRFGLKEACVVPKSYDMQFIKEQMARAGLKVIRRILSDGKVVGLVWAGSFGREAIESLATTGAVGEICSVFYDINGREVQTPFSDRIIAVGLEKLRQDSGEHKGETLSALLAGDGKAMLGSKAKDMDYFPLLIKFIDAKGDLSVQVHPDDEYALREEGEQGKTEMWYVVDAESGASLIYGFRQEISKEDFEQRIANNTLLEVCNKVLVHKGDVFFIKAGTLHAIGSGILIYEVQQSSNMTYRVYDYGRVGKDGKPRQLHIDKALAVTKLEVPQAVAGRMV